MSNKIARPDTYNDWRRKWHYVARELGWHISHNICMGRPLMDRVTWKYYRQMHRIHNRLEVERLADTESYWEAFTDMFLRELKARSKD